MIWSAAAASSPAHPSAGKGQSTTRPHSKSALSHSGANHAPAHSLHAPAHRTRAPGHSAHQTRGQQAIESDRARQIQEALIREKYLDGDASGVWDQRTKEALSRFQEENGWQSKVVPDSRALIKLGLGPS
jgi:sulfite reductase alpha subunit-like flavoprotein